MRWYKTAASKPPAYIVERISDLRHAARVSMTAPGSAKSMIFDISAQLRQHNDDDYASALDEAARIMIDSPSRARAIITSAIESMEVDVEEQEAKKEKQWLKR